MLNQGVSAPCCQLVGHAMPVHAGVHELARQTCCKLLVTISTWSHFVSLRRSWQAPLHIFVLHAIYWIQPVRACVSIYRAEHPGKLQQLLAYLDISSYLVVERNL